MAIAFGPKRENGTYAVIEVKDPKPLAYECDTNLKGDHKDLVPVFDPDQQVNVKFRGKQIPLVPIVIK